MKTTISLTEAFEAGWLVHQIAAGPGVHDARDVFRHLGTDDWPPALRDLAQSLDVHGMVGKHNALVAVKQAIYQRLQTAPEQDEAVDTSKPPVIDIPDFIVRSITRSIEDYRAMKGMRIHNGKAMFDISHVSWFLSHWPEMPLATDSGQTLQDIANGICGRLPEGYIASLCLENGAAWCELVDRNGNSVELPDSADKSLLEQLNEAVDAAD